MLQLAHMQNFLERESEWVNLASLYMHNGLPLKAAQIVKQGMKKGIIKKDKRAYKMLAESLIHARASKEAVEPLRTAAKMEKKGDLYVQLAQLHVGMEQWTKAIQALNLALKKGKLTNPGSTYLLMGMCKNNLNQYRGAISAFNMAKKHKQTQDSAKQWINIVKMKMRGG